MRLPLTVNEPMSFAARIVALLVNCAGAVYLMPETIDPPMVTLAIRPDDSISPEKPNEAEPVMLPPVRSWPILTDPMSPPLEISPVS